MLELYPSLEQQGIPGRFMAEVREKRRSGAGTLSPEDYWMLESESLPGGVNLPRLRWARKDDQDPKSAAHLAVAFDTFESRVVPSGRELVNDQRPLYAFGLLIFLSGIIRVYRPQNGVVPHSHRRTEKNILRTERTRSDWCAYIERCKGA